MLASGRLISGCPGYVDQETVWVALLRSRAPQRRSIIPRSRRPSLASTASPEAQSSGQATGSVQSYGASVHAIIQMNARYTSFNKAPLLGKNCIANGVCCDQNENRHHRQSRPGHRPSPHLADNSDVRNCAISRAAALQASGAIWCSSGAN